MRRTKVWLLILLIVMLSALPLTRADARIVVGVSTVNVAFLPIYVTQDKGFFKDEGLDVLVVMFNAGATNLQALIGGDVQIMAGGVPETVLARASGLDIKNFWAISNLMPFQIYGNPSFKSLKESKGKKVRHQPVWIAVGIFDAVERAAIRRRSQGNNHVADRRDSGAFHHSGLGNRRCHGALVSRH